MVLRVGDRVGQREDEIEVRHAHRAVQIVAEHTDIGLGEGRVDIDVAPVNFESAVAQHQAHLSLGAVEKSAFGELNDRPSASTVCLSAWNNPMEGVTGVSIFVSISCKITNNPVHIDRFFAYFYENRTDRTMLHPYHSFRWMRASVHLHQIQ